MFWLCVISSVTTYACTGGNAWGSCQQVSNGPFQTLDDCKVSPCQCDSIITAWPFYLNNPNYQGGAGSWHGGSHDGPSNQNALATILTNVQNSNAYTSTNPTQLHKAKCREAAILHWQSTSPGAGACCSDVNFAIGAATSDPNGCVSQNFIDMINNNFIPNSANWPNGGCNWLQNSFNNAQTQQANFPVGTTGYCKLQGKMDFLTNLMNTGTSPYIIGSVSFTAPC